jgi:hypothetical protein
MSNSDSDDGEKAPVVNKTEELAKPFWKEEKYKKMVEETK